MKFLLLSSKCINLTVIGFAISFCSWHLHGASCRNWLKYQISHVVRIIINVIIIIIIIIIYSYCWPCWPCTWINVYFKLKSGVLFWKRDFKSSWSAYWPSLLPEKTISCQDMSLLWNSWIFFNVSWHHDKHTQYTTNCTNLHPTPTSDPLAKVKLAFCTSS